MRATLLLLLLLSLPAPIASAQPAASPTEAPARDASPRPAAQASALAPPAAEVSAAPGKGLTVTSADKRAQVTVRSRIQLRDTVSHEADTTTNEVQVKTLRLFVQGYVLDPNTKYTIQFAFGSKDFEPGNPSPIFDAFLDLTHLRDLSLRVGQFFVPFDRARTIREFALHLVDRQQVVRELTLDRDVGAMLYSQDLFGLGGVLGYHLFVGGGEGRNHAIGEESGPMLVGRVAFRPFGAFDDDQEGDLERRTSPRLALGLAAGYNPQTSRAQSTYGAQLGTARFNYAHAAADLAFKFAGFSLLTEAVVRSADRDFVTVTAADGTASREWSREAWGYFAQAGYMLTDHVEVVGRWDHLVAFGAATDPDLEATIAGFGKQAGGGVNVYLNGHAFKLQADYFRTFGEVGEGRHAARVQLDASF